MGLGPAARLGDRRRPCVDGVVSHRARDMVGGVLILATGVLVLAFVHELLPHGRGFSDWLLRWALSLLAGGIATAVVFFVAGLGYYLRCPPF